MEDGADPPDAGAGPVVLTHAIGTDYTVDWTRTLGRGAFGRVVACTCNTTGALYAVKVIPTSLYSAHEITMHHYLRSVCESKGENLRISPRFYGIYSPSPCSLPFPLPPPSTPLYLARARLPPQHAQQRRGGAAGASLPQLAAVSQHTGHLPPPAGHGVHGGRRPPAVDWKYGPAV